MGTRIRSGNLFIFLEMTDFRPRLREQRRRKPAELGGRRPIDGRYQASQSLLD